MTSMTASSLPISASLPVAESSSAADIGRQSSSSAASAEASGFPQMLASQRQAQQAAHAEPNPRARGTNTPRNEADDNALSGQPEAAALQWIATLLPGLTPMADARDAASANVSPDADLALAGQRRPGLNLAMTGIPSSHTQEAVDKTLAASGNQANALPALLNGSTGQPSADDATSLAATLLPAGANAERPQARIADRFTLQRSNLPPDNAQARTGETAASTTAPSSANPAIGAQADANVSFQQSSVLAAADTASHSIAQLVTAGSSAPLTAQAGNTTPAALGTTPSALFVPTPVGQAGWGQAMAQQVAYALNGTGSIRQAEMRLDPPDLGPLRVTLQIQDNIAHAWFVSPHASVRQAVETALPQLAQQLADAGLSLGNTHVGSEQAGSQAFEQALSQQGQARTGGSADTVTSGVDTATPATSPVASHLLVDTYA